MPHAHTVANETVLANFITDSFGHYFNSDFAFMHSGGIRAALSKGSVSFNDILAVLPFGNSVVHVSMRGKISQI
ncbi:MAG: 5'-nucleotidase [candidate division KSB1 bacterium]|nr:5'-nucleotidase [candidate division KSB1 bacterium]